MAVVDQDATYSWNGGMHAVDQTHIKNLLLTSLHPWLAVLSFHTTFSPYMNLQSHNCDN